MITACFFAQAVFGRFLDGAQDAFTSLEAQTCSYIDVTYDWCRSGALKVNGHVVPAGSSYTFSVSENDRFAWYCDGNLEHSRIRLANTITARVSTEGRISWTGKSCFDGALALEAQSCSYIDVTYDWCRSGALKVNGHVVPAGSSYTFSVSENDRFAWYCDGNLEHSRIKLANTITAHVSTEGRISWTGESCSNDALALEAQSCSYIDVTYDWCRSGALKVNGHVVPAGSSYTFSVSENDRFAWYCDGTLEHSRIRLANTITAHVSTEGRISWTGESCSNGALALEAQSCSYIDVTYDWCRSGALKVNGHVVPAGSSYTFSVSENDRFAWYCDGTLEHSRIRLANTIQARVSTEGRITWTGESCFNGDLKIAEL